MVDQNGSPSLLHTTHSSLQPRMSGEWHTGEVVNLCKSYGFIRISKDGKSEDIFFYYGDVRAPVRAPRPRLPTTLAMRAVRASPIIPRRPPCARRLLEPPAVVIKTHIYHRRDDTPDPETARYRKNKR